MSANVRARLEDVRISVPALIIVSSRIKDALGVIHPALPNAPVNAICSSACLIYVSVRTF